MSVKLTNQFEVYRANIKNDHLPSLHVLLKWEAFFGDIGAI